MGHRACLYVRRLLKQGIFTGCASKVRITVIQTLMLVTRKTPTFILKVTLRLLLFLIAWLWEYSPFSDSSVVSLNSSPQSEYTQLGPIFPKKIVFHYQTFFLLQICSLLDFSQQIPDKKIGGHHARLRERKIYFAIELSLREILYVLYVHALMCAR